MTPDPTPTPAAADLDLPGVPGLRLARPDPGTTATTTSSGPGLLEVSLAAGDGRPGLRLEVDLADAVAWWHPMAAGTRPLPPDWSGRTVTSLVSSVPLGALHDATGRVLLGWAADEDVAELAVTLGVSEEHKTFVVEARPVRPRATPLRVLLDTSGETLATVAQRLTGWLSDRHAEPPLDPPPAARVPVYSTWYTFTQDVDDAVVTAEGALAARLGCGSLFLDDGWQRFARGRGYQGCGDWVADPEKFPDLTGTVARLHAQGLAVALWVAPLLLGDQSAVFARMAPFAPVRVEEGLRCHVLDPRHAEVRAFVVETCLRLVVEHDVDLLKIDFLDQAMVYRDEPGEGDVGEAMAALLADLRRALVDADRAGVGFEFRQPYVSPALARSAQVLRAGDCPADAVVNRRSVVDARLVAAGRVVHADPMMWGPVGGAAAVAQQLYAGWFAVPQISMRLAALEPVQSAALEGLLGLWREHAEVTQHGVLEVTGAEDGYATVSAVRPDLDRAVVVRHAPVVVDLDAFPIGHVDVVNATAEPRVTVRTRRPVLDGTARTAAGAGAGPVTAAGPGLLDLPVDPWGSLRLRLG
ncbi:glycoside hydrolase family 36 protein [Microlunatus capsulatus]|uniref:Alpha-galactosidase n=1 Tax=Microlunatus capsulatus TaxID=99117 RepID=A0ABS4ZAM2_9ACTN|nr:glycoside hydrolase family 36 protein [Microlunatus capsulatus]MBP2418104.1 alpha-galactosidase [Microlunatus capsulatus]